MVDRKLAAILAADAVGYSKLMGSDESGTLIRLRSVLEDVVEPVSTPPRRPYLQYDR